MQPGAALERGGFLGFYKGGRDLLRSLELTSMSHTFAPPFANRI